MSSETETPANELEVYIKMLKLFFCLLLLLGLIGCNRSVTPNNTISEIDSVVVTTPSVLPDPTPISPNLTPVATEANVVDNVSVSSIPSKIKIPKNAPMFANWISPSKVEIGNFHEGATAEYKIMFHNSVNETVDQKIVITGINDNEGSIPLKSAGLYLDSITSIISVTSNESEDKLVVRSYNKETNSIFVTGFIDNTIRIITIKYIPMTAYSLYARLPDYAIVPVSANIAINWITIEKPVMLMSPLETQENLVTIIMPKGVTLPDKNFEIWIGVIEIRSTGGTAVSLEMISRCIINMKA